MRKRDFDKFIINNGFNANSSGGYWLEISNEQAPIIIYADWLDDNKRAFIAGEVCNTYQEMYNACLNRITSYILRLSRTIETLQLQIDTYDHAINRLC